jgi:hypothetical protein
MELEPEFPFEFLVEGVPVASKNTGASKQEWIEDVKARYSVKLPEGHWATMDPVYVTILYFPSAPMQGDVDNIVKHIVDAMKNSIYVDDKQVERVIVQKFEPHRAFAFTNPTSTLAQALETAPPVVYVRVDTEGTAKEIWA